MTFEDIHRPLTSAGFRGAIRAIIIVSGVMLILQQFAGYWLVPHLGLVPSKVLQEFWLWQPLTYLFLHSGIFHWLFNMFILWMFGRELEVRWGTAYFVRYFLICGLGAALCVLLLSPNSSVATIGASGAAYGIMTGFAMVFPDAVLYMYFVVPVKAWQAVVLLGLVQFFAGLGGGGAGLSRFAHLGGILTGYVYLRSGGFFAVRTWGPIQRLRQQLRGIHFRRKRAVEFHEVTDELVKEVDRILEKILKQGADSLTDKEKQLMERYSKLKH